MTHQEKAKELVEKFIDIPNSQPFRNRESISNYNAKQCALICVEEKIKTYLSVCKEDGRGYKESIIKTNSSYIELEQEKQEINNL